MSILTEDQIVQFHDVGFLTFERFFNDEECARLKDDIDAVEARRRSGEHIGQPLAFPALGPLISHEPVMQMVSSLMGPHFHFHHLHATRQDAGCVGVNWHQDYEQFPQSNRSHLMVHLFYYLNGLNGEIGDLLVLPRSQGRIVANDGLWHLGTETLPGTVVIDALPEGSAVLVHSALWHARRAKPGGETRPRYFADASYCQAGVRWPGYGARDWRAQHANARALGLDGHGRYPTLLDESAFFDEPKARALVHNGQGSLVIQLPNWME